MKVLKAPHYLPMLHVNVGLNQLKVTQWRLNPIARIPWAGGHQYHAKKLSPKIVLYFKVLWESKATLPKYVLYCFYSGVWFFVGN